MPKLNPALFDPLTRIENACRRVSNNILTAPDPPRDSKLVRTEIQEMTEALEASQRQPPAAAPRRGDGSGASMQRLPGPTGGKLR